MPLWYLALVVIAVMVVTKYLGHLFLAQHADSPAAQGASAVLL